MKTRKIILMIMIFIIMSFVNSTCNAATGSFKVSKSSISITKRETSTFTISVSNCEGQFTITSSDTSVATVSSSSEWVSGSTTITVTGKKAGTAKITVKANDVADTDENEVTGSNTISVTVKDTTPTLSNDATLKNLGITPHDFTNFKSGTTSYTVDVPYETESIKIYAEKNNSKATVSGTGTKTLNVGKNTFNVKVTAEDGKTTKTYTLIINRKEKEEETVSSDATLKNLGITPAEYDFSTFKKSTTSYDIDVPYEAEKIEIYAYATSSKAKITGTGSQTLNVGKNTFNIKVTAEDGKTTKTYTLNINRKEENEEDPNEEPADNNVEQPGENQPIEQKGLTKLEIEGYTLTPEFNANTYEYKVNITDEINKLDITTEVSSEEYEVVIAGNEDLKQGENVITLLVHNKADDTTTTYQIVANIGGLEVDLADINYIMDKAQNSFNKQLLIIKGTIILIIVLIVIYLIERYNIQKKEKEDLSRFEKDEDIEEENFMKNHFKTEYLDEYDNNLEEEVIKKPNHKKGKRFK